MNHLTIFYDSKCGLCSRFKSWLEKEPAYVELLFHPYDSLEAERILPGIERYDPEKELLVLADNGDLYRGADSWIMCLWATRNHRLQAARLAQPGIKPLVKRICVVVSSGRHNLSALLHLSADADLASDIAKLEAADPSICEAGHCKV